MVVLSIIEDVLLLFKDVTSSLMSSCCCAVKISMAPINLIISSSTVVFPKEKEATTVSEILYNVDFIILLLITLNNIKNFVGCAFSHDYKKQRELVGLICPYSLRYHTAKVPCTNGEESARHKNTLIQFY